MKYKFISEDEKIFKVMHPDGSEFHIAKNSIGPEVHKRIKSLEPIKMAEGGEVEKPLDIEPDTESNASDLNISPASNQELGIPQQQQPQIQQEPLISDQSNRIPAEVANQDLTSGYTPAIDKNFAQKEKAITDSAAIQNQAIKNQAKVLEKLSSDEEKINQDTLAKTAPLEARSKELFDSVINGKVDHNRYYSNMSTGNKILAAISLALGGLGSGLNGKPNMAMEVIQKNIDRDIEDQKLELGKRQTLFSENLRLLGDTRAAASATKAQLLSAAEAKIHAYQAQSNSAEVNQKAQVMLADIGLQRDQLKNSAAYRTMGMQGGNYDPSLLVPRLVPPARQAEVFKEIKDAQNIRRGSVEGLKAFDEATKEQRILSKNVIPGINSPYLGQLKASVLPQFQNIDGTVRQAAMDNFLPTVTPAIGDTQHTINIKRQTLENWYQAHSAAPTALGYGINIDKFGSTTSQQQPKAKTVDGVTYMRGPNGEAIKVK